MYDERFATYRHYQMNDIVAPNEDADVWNEEHNYDPKSENIPSEQIMGNSQTEIENIPRSAAERQVDEFHKVPDEELEEPNLPSSYCEATEVENGYEMPLSKENIRQGTDQEKNGREDVSDENKSKQCEHLDSPNNVEGAEMTSISNASKLRNLEATSDSSPREGSSEKRSDKTTTSISSVSRKRNLDQITTESSPSEEAKKSSDKDSDKSKLSSGLKETDSGCTSTDIVNQCKGGNKNKKRKEVKRLSRKKFVPPRKLSVREIRQEFEEQDRKLLESSPSSSNYSKYLEQLIKRPSIKQIQNATHVAYITKTNQGIEVIPAPAPKKRRRKSPIKRHFSNENFNMSIFSDKNAGPFERYLNSTERDYKAYTFNFQKTQENCKKLLDGRFEPTVENRGEYTDKSVTIHFVRNNSEIFKNQLEPSRSQEKSLVRRMSEISQRSMFITQQSIQTLTPDGFYKQNKEDINKIMDKYLLSGGSVGLRQSGSGTDRSFGKVGSIFENDVNVSDLDI